MIGLATLAVSVGAGWRFGAAWGVVTLLACLLGLALWAGRDMEKQLEDAESRAGTLIPPGYAISLDGAQLGQGTWIPPGYVITAAPGMIKDGRGNTIGPGRIAMPKARNSTIIG